MPTPAESSLLPDIVPQAMSAKWAKGTSGPARDEVANLVPVRIGGGFDGVVPFDTTQITSAANYSQPRAGDTGHPLAAGAHPPAIAFAQAVADPLCANEQRTYTHEGENNFRTRNVVAFSAKDHGADAGEIAPTLRSMGHDGSHANGGGQVAVAFESRFARNGRGAPDTIVPPLKAQSGETERGDAAPLLQHGMQVRRLTPVECARLQGFPDHYLDITYRGKSAADGPKYKALGNSMAVPCMRWIGRQIQRVSVAPRVGPTTGGGRGVDGHKR